MQHEPVSRLSGLVFMVWRTECYTVHCVQDRESFCTMKSKLQLYLNTQFQVNN